MIIDHCEQLSEEWYAKRCGVPSASNFNKIVTTKGEISKQSDNYIFQLAGERILGFKEEGYTNANMQRGIDLEGEAIQYYELYSDDKVEKVGIVYQDERKLFSCSPDGLVQSKKRGLEIKCPLLHTHVGYLYKNELPKDYYQQVQGCLFVTGYESWDFMSYYPGLPPLIIRIFPNKNFHHRLEYSLDIVCHRIDEVEELLKDMI
jgi:putative phage-type endonuclease